MTKPCTLCSTPRDILIRCQIDDTAKWHFVCPGACWKSVSGGVEDARGLEGKYPYYRYGGMVLLNLGCFETKKFVADEEVQWKDRSADGPISAKKPRKVKERQKEEMKKREDGKVADGSHGSEEGSDE